MTSPVAESRILTQVLANLAAEPGCALLMPDGTLRGDPAPRAIFWRMNTGKSHTVTGRRISFGVPGQADITGAIRGRRIEIELKTDDGRQSPAQRQFQQLAESAGALYVLARNLGDVLTPVRNLLSEAPKSCTP